MNLSGTATKSAILSIVGNLILAIIKGLGGFLGHSDALIADAVESTSDVFASIFVLIGIRYSLKPADENHPYGHGKAEPLFTFIVVGFLLVSATLIISNSIANLSQAQETPEAYTLYIVGTIVIIKEIFFQVLRHKSRKINSSILLADAWHHRADAITSLVTFLGIAATLILGPGYETFDDWAAIIASLIITYNAYRLLRPALGEIMDEHVHDDLVEEIREVCIHIPDVVDTEKCFVRKTGTTYHVDLHLRVDGNLSVTQGHDIAHITKAAIKKEIPFIADILIHVEPA